MEVEIKLTNEEIARVFAMYLGCNFWLCDNLEGNPVIEKVTSTIVSEIEKGDWLGYDNRPGELLLLAPLELISDEDAIAIACFEDTGYKKLNFSTYKKDGFNFLVEKENTNIKCSYNYKTWFYDGVFDCKYKFSLDINTLNWKSYQLMLKKGYAVPLFFGVNHWANGKTAIELKIAIQNPSI